MSSDRPKRYKNYLEPDSEDPIPSSSWYRYKNKQLAKKELPDRPPDVENLDKIPTETITEMNVMEGSASYMTEENEESMMDTSENVENLGIRQSTKKTSVEKFQISRDTIVGSDSVFRVVQSLAEDIHAIENEMQHCFEEESKEVDDYFLDVIEEEDDYNCYKDTIEDDDTERLSSKCFKSLQDAISSNIFQKKIDVSINRSVGEVLLMVLKFVLTHALSLTAINDLFNLINCIFAEPFLPNSRYLIDKLFFPKNCTKLYGTCPKCGTYVGKFERKDNFLKCKICKAKIDFKDYAYKDFFVMMDVASPISKLIETNSEYYNYVVQQRVHEKDSISDIYDGKRYREFVNNLNEPDRHSYATTVFNADGAPLFKSSAYSIWPIFLMVNEVEYHVRSKELVLAGLWFGKDKPNMSIFLEPFVDQMNELSSKGVQCIINGVERCIKVFTLICCVDSVARAPVQGFTQFNGAYGCGQCLHPGEWVRSHPKRYRSIKRSGSMKYPLTNEVPKDRNVEDTIKQMMEAANSRKPIFGVKCPSQLINLVHYDIIYGCIADSMHCCSGVAKQFATTWFGNKNKAGLFPKSIVSQIDTLMTNIKAPHQIVRLTRSFSEKEFWKAREWENWTIFYSMIILQNILPDHLLMHWALFVEAFYILNKDKLNIQELDRADELLHEFVARTQILYSKVSMTFNVHLLLHLARSVLDWGPLFSHNAYTFESGNGNLLKVIQAAKGVHHQICRGISLKYSFLRLKDHVYPFSSFIVKHFCNTIGTNMAKYTLKTNSRPIALDILVPHPESMHHGYKN